MAPCNSKCIISHRSCRKLNKETVAGCPALRLSRIDRPKTENCIIFYGTIVIGQLLNVSALVQRLFAIDQKVLSWGNPDFQHSACKVEVDRHIHWLCKIPGIEQQLNTFFSSYIKGHFSHATLFIALLS
mgnify:CR=1 FL=1